MKNAYQRRRVKARVEKRARMMKLDTITLDFARQVIEEETGAPLEIQAPSPVGVNRTPSTGTVASGAPNASAGSGPAQAASSGEPRLIARDDKKNPLISIFDWTSEAVQRIVRVPAGYMRNKTQERIEELARERAAAVIDLGLVEEGIEIGKRMMAEMIASYSSTETRPDAAPATRGGADPSTMAARGIDPSPASNGRGYLNEVSPLTAGAAAPQGGPGEPWPKRA
jgi:hypothetical protein